MITQTFLSSHLSLRLQLIWPLLRCVGNLLSAGPPEDLKAQLSDSRLLAALCAFAQAFLQTHPALARESTWVLNNLTGETSLDVCLSNS